MRKIPCDTCRSPLSASWIIFDSLMICETCRLYVIGWMRAQGFSLAHAHPFTDEFMTVEQPRKSQDSGKFLAKLLDRNSAL